MTWYAVCAYVRVCACICTLYVNAHVCAVFAQLQATQLIQVLQRRSLTLSIAYNKRHDRQYEVVGQALKQQDYNNSSSSSCMNRGMLGIL